MIVVLPAPLWPKQAHYLAVIDREVDSIDSQKIPVSTGQLFRLDHSSLL